MLKKVSEFFETGTKGKLFALFLFLGLAAYANSLDNSFHLDDHTSLRNVRSVRDYNNLGLLVKDRTENFIAYLTFAFNHHLSGQKVYSYHVVNIAIHMAAAWMVFLLIQMLLAEKQKLLLKEARWCAVWAALLFLLHPLQTQAVTYIVQRIASLAALFYITSVYSYIRARLSGKKLFYGLALLSALAAFFTKQNTYSLPLVLLVYEILWRDEGGRVNIKGLALRLIPYAGLLAAVYFALYHSQVVTKGLATAASEREGLDRMTYFLTELTVIPYYLKLTVVPWGQALEYDWTWAKSLFEPRTLSGAVVVLTFFLSGFWLWKRQAKVAAFGVFWFFVTMSIESSIIPLPDPVFEHRMYLPMAGLAMLFAGFALKLKTKRWGVGALAVFILILMGLTIQRNRVWDTPISLYEDNLKKYPEHVRLLLNLADAYEEAGDFDQEKELLEKAYAIVDSKERNLENDTFRLRILTGRAKVARRDGKLDQAQAYLEEMKQYTDIGFDTVPLCYVLFAQGELEEASRCAEEHLEKLPNYYWPSFIVGKVALEKGDFDKAEKYLVMAFENLLAEREETGYSRHQYELGYAIMYELGLTMMNENKMDRAVVFLEQATAENALRAEPYYLKALCYFALKRFPDALNQIKILNKLGRKDLVDQLRKRVRVSDTTKLSDDEETREKYKLIVAQVEQAKQANQTIRNTKALWNKPYQGREYQNWLPFVPEEKADTQNSR